MNTISILTAALGELQEQRVKKILHLKGYQVVSTSSHMELPRQIRKIKPALVIMGLEQTDSTLDLAAVHAIRCRDQQTPIVVVVPEISTGHVLAAMRAGVNDYLQYQFCHDDLRASLTRCLPTARCDESNAPQPVAPQPAIVGDSRCMQDLKTYLAKVATTDSTLLITGETGTGKELAAAYVHRHSPRAAKPIVCVNCAALPDSLVESELFGFEKGAFTGAVAAKGGKFEQAADGTLFLDEIGDMSLSAQAKILRIIENKESYRLGGLRRIPVNVRVIAATNQNLEELVKAGRFREDLFYRLTVAQITIPPLRERKEDLAQLGEFFIDRMNRRFARDVQGFTPQAQTALIAYHWPGNVRELKNLVEAAFINLPVQPIAQMDLPSPFKNRLNATRTLPPSERDRLLAALYATRWNKSKAARKLNWSRMTLYRKMAKYAIANGQNAG